MLETGCFVFSSGQWGSSSPPAPPGYSTVLRKEDENVIVKALKFEVSCIVEEDRHKRKKKASRDSDEEKWTGDRGRM